MKTDTEKYQMQITRTQKFLQNIVDNNDAKKWTDMKESSLMIADIIKWSKENGYEPEAELFFQGRQCGRIDLAKHTLAIIGRPLDPDEGGLLTYDESKKLVQENERLREALQNVIEATAIKGKEGHASIVVLAKSLLKMESIARSALQQKDSVP